MPCRRQWHEEEIIGDDGPPLGPCDDLGRINPAWQEVDDWPATPL
jgi:hypothetical protein